MSNRPEPYLFVCSKDVRHEFGPQLFTPREAASLERAMETERVSTACTHKNCGGRMGLDRLSHGRDAR